MLGGAAEEIVYGTKTTWTVSDIEQATAIARRIVTRWGISEPVRLVQLAPRENAYVGGGLSFHSARRRPGRSTPRSAKSRRGDERRQASTVAARGTHSRPSPWSAMPSDNLGVA